MTRFRPSRFSWILGLTLGFWVIAAQADEFRYHYVSLDQVELPPGFVGFDPGAINDSGRVYGNAYDASGVAHVAVYAAGAVTVFQPGNAVVANARGTIGGFVTIDPENYKFQAALFRGRDVEIIPFLPGETTAFVVSINDLDTALVRSADSFTYQLYRHGNTTFRFRLPTGSDFPSAWAVNNGGMISGEIDDPHLHAFRAIRFQPPYKKPIFLDPLPTDVDSTSFGINNLGYVLGTSRDRSDDPSATSYGIWGRNGNFTTYFKGIYYKPLFNDKNLIVLTENLDTDFNSYLVPRPGVRLNVEDLVDNATSVEAPLAQVLDINNRGDMVGYGLCSFPLPCPKFLLRRVFP